MRHDSNFHAKFLEYIASSSLGGGGGMGEMPAKRMRDASGMGMGVVGGDPIKNALVQQVKAFQKTPEGKELWGQYVDTYLGGVRDPARHDAATLQEFCTNHGVAAPGGSAGGMGAARVG